MCSLPKGDALSLPKGWEVKKLGEVCEIKTGKSNANQAIQNGQYAFFDRSKKIKKSNRYLFDCDALIIPGEGSAFFPKHYSGKFDLHQRAYTIFNFNEYVNIHFVEHYLNFNHKYFERVAVGATVKSLRLRHFQELQIQLPPLPEQKRIVAILDQAFTAINQAKANTEKNLKNARELFQSKLQETFDNGKLKIDNGEWEEKKLGEVTLKIGSGATPRGGKANYKKEGISLIRSMNVHDLHFKEKNLAFIDEQQANALSNVTIQEEDVLLNITGASIARCCIVLKEYLPARVNQHVSIIRANKEIVNPVFLASLLTSKFFKDQILGIGKQGATRQAITKIQLENFVISFPKTTKEQKQIVKKLDSLSTETKKLEAIYQQKITCLDELKKSILQKAFSGGL